MTSKLYGGDGHRRGPVASACDALRGELCRYEPAELVGVSCIARGADSIFARVVLDLGGTLEVVIPSEDYRATKVGPDHAALFDHLVRSAGTVRVLPRADAGRAAYEAADAILLRESDALIAVWDGRGEVERGGTRAVVAQAEALRLPTTVIWPAGAARRS